MLNNILSYLGLAKKSKPTSLKEAYISKELDFKQCNVWMKKVGVSKLHTNFTPFEDPNLVEGVPPIDVQLKTETIKEFRRKYESTKN